MSTAGSGPHTSSWHCRGQSASIQWCTAQLAQFHAVEPQPRASSELTSIMDTQSHSEPPTRRGCRSRIKPDSFSSCTDSSGQRRSSAARAARSFSFGTRKRARVSASSSVSACAAAAACATAGILALARSDAGFGGLLLRSFGGGVVELDRHAVRILDEDLVQPEDRHRALVKGDVVALAALEHRLAPGGGEGDVVERTGAAVRCRAARADILVERAGIVLVETHEMHEAVVARGVLQVRGRLAAVEPVAGEIERRPRPRLQPDHLGVEAPRFFEVERADRVVVDAFDFHGTSLFDLDLVLAHEFPP